MVQGSIFVHSPKLSITILQCDALSKEINLREKNSFKLISLHIEFNLTMTIRSIGSSRLHIATNKNNTKLGAESTME